MNRWFWKRWVWAVVVGTTAAVGLTVAQQGTDAPTGPPKVGDVITLKFRDMPDRQVKVLKSDKQPDGSIMSEVKDTKTGETFTLMDKPDSFAAPAKAAPEKAGAKAPAVTPPPSPTAPKATEPAKAPAARPPVGPMKLPDGLPKAKPRTSDPLLPSLKEALPDLPTPKEQEKEKERRFLPSFGKSSDSKSSDAPKPVEPDEEKPGLLKRIFGKKKPAESTPTLPPATVINNAKPQAFPAAPPAPAGAKPPAAVPTPGVMKAHPTVTLEPPRSQPVQPVQPPVPLTPTPVAVPTAPPASVPLPIPAIPAAPPAPGPAALPAIPSVPSVPSIPVPPPGGLPSIPLPPGGTSMKEPVTKSEVAVAPKPLPAKIAAAPVKEPEPVAAAPKAAPVPAKEKEPAVVTAQVPATPAPAAVVTAGKTAPAALPPVVAVPATDPGRTAMMRDIEPHVAALEKGVAPSQRAMAARALGGCRHGSSDTVKMTIFRAAQNDPNPMVRAVCIEELCKLGYFEPAFELHLTKACEDANDEVRSAAKAAMKQMYPRR
ncbi:hypothetical protein : : HEAT_2 [Gemmataceae bacterium]|nr:hypothetical protein : : HEAT_2 [Gemmataceae bacterium]VTT96686.1 hypothetical protein : : HEAT_2 [Gemmataceae bacterium]